jgi:hypothetical protein
MTMGTTELLMKHLIKKMAPATKRQSYVKLIFSLSFMSKFQKSFVTEIAVDIKICPQQIVWNGEVL